jgi:hypothetical protein
MRSGLILREDMESLLNGQARPNVPDQARTRQIADRLLQESRLLPSPAERRVRAVFSHCSETVVGEDGPGLGRRVELRATVIDHGARNSFSRRCKCRPLIPKPRVLAALTHSPLTGGTISSSSLERKRYPLSHRRNR